VKADLLRDRYEPIEVVGRGGEGRVVRAIDRQHDRQVALKIRPAPVGAMRDELLREARILLSLDPHLGLPLVRDDFFNEDDYVIVMDWIEGTDLDRLLRHQGMPGLAPSTALRYLAQVAEALTHLHAHHPPVIHGDVKPANLIVTSRGRIVLVDFGLASVGDLAARAGTSGFVAPEIAAGGPRTRASDIYSLAVTAYALLTGNMPGAGGPAWPSGIDAERKRIFERAIRFGTVVDPARRPSSAGELIEQLRAGWESDLPVGVLTVCMTDIENSTGLWEAHPHTMGAALVRHDAIIAQVVEARRGHLIQSMGEGDSTVSVFSAAGDAVRAAAELVARLAEEPWPDGIVIRTRVGLHTGETASPGIDRLGPTAARAARVRALADGGQVFLSQATARLVEDQLPEGFGQVDLGSHTLRGFINPENVYALSAPSLHAPPSPAVSPYRGLLAFEPEDHDLFFGREEILTDLLGRLASNPFVAVVGASGSGKSSLVRAGVIARIHQGQLASVSNAALMTPGADPVEALHTSGVTDLNLLVVDQFEEVFSLCPDESQRTRFFEELLAYRGTVLIALRADFYGHCAAHERLAQLVARNNVLLGPMTEGEMRRAVVSPAEAAELRLEPGLVDLVLRDAAGEPGALPLLSHALMETWARRDGRTLTLAGYRDAGGVRGAIARTAEDVYDRCTEDERRLIRQVFLRLTELGEGTEDTRRRVPLIELAMGPESATVVAELLDTLTRARLLTLDEGTAQVAHEALIREWPRLRGWLNEDREGLMVHRHLTRSARAWEAIGRDPGELYRGARLAAALDWAGGRVDLTADERAFLDASGAAQERELREARRRARRLRGLLAGVAVLLVLALVAGSVALVQRQNARRSAILAQAGRLAAQSREVVGTHPDLGLLLALEAERLDSSVDTRGALIGALERGSRIAAWLQGSSAPVNATAFSRDGLLLATVSFDGTTLWDASSWRPVGPSLRSTQGGWEGVDFSPDGQTLAIAGGKGKVELWDVATRREVGELAAPAGAALASVRYSPDGKVIAAGAIEDNHVTLWDAATGQLLGSPIEAKEEGLGGAQTLAFSPDSRRLAVPAAPGAIGIWDVAMRRPIAPPLLVGEDDMESVVFTPDGRSLVVGDDSGAVSMWDLATGDRIGKTMSVGDIPASFVDVSPDGRLLAAGAFDGTIRVWDAASGAPFGLPLQADASPVAHVTFSPDGRLLATAHYRSAIVWDLSGRRAIGEPLGGLGQQSSSVAFRPDGREVAVGGYDGSVVLLDRATQEDVGRFEVGQSVLSLAFSPDGKLLATGSVDGKVRLWDVATRAEAGQPLDVGPAWVWQVAFSPDGELLAVATDPNGPRDIFNPDRQGEVQLWGVGTHQPVGRPMVPGKHSVVAVAFSPDGRLLATGSQEERAQLWDVATQERVGLAMDVPDEAVLAVAFSPDGSRLATGGVFGVVRLWDVGTQIAAAPPLTGHLGPVVGVAYDPGGRFLATTSLFGDTRLWDPASGLAYGDDLTPGEVPASMASKPDLPSDILPLRTAFSRDGRFLAVAGIASRAMLWDLDLRIWRKRACDIAGRNLTRDEWNLYLPPRTPYRATCSEWPTG
jgi:WD40 repeat protein/class 3 adenylate cyclase/tRNA A-37 threonylcarbamoyl transferase component Bud32